MITKKFLSFCASLAVISTAIFFMSPAHSLAFNGNNLIDDAIFNNTNTMTAAQIDSWLNTNFPSSCISTNHGFSSADPTGYNPSQGFLYGGPVTAGQVIADSAHAYGINPQVLLTTLQKEQSLVTGTGSGCVSSDANTRAMAYVAAMGYGCPDNITSHSYPSEGALPTALYYINGVAVTSVSGTCVNSPAKAGFSEQVIHGAWLLKFGQQRSEGNTGWAVISGNWDNSDDPNTCYGGPMTQGNFKRCSSDSATTFYDGYTTIDGTSTHMDTGSTAALYWYTPHFSGNQSFDNIFQSWFGSLYFSISSIILNNLIQPDATPALGETVTYKVSFTNNSSSDITLDAIGIVGRLGSVNGANRDFGWQGPVTIAAGQTSSQYTFTTTVQDLGTIYAWPAINYHGTYAHYNNWGALMSSHIPNIGATLTPTTSPTVGQTDSFSVVLRNLESHAINLDAAGIPIRYLGRYNYDTGWSGSMTIAANGGTSSALTGNVTYDKPGAYTEWVSVKIGSQYITVSPTINVDASLPAPSPSNIQLSYSATPNANPALGEDVTVAFTLKNTYGVPITLDAVGIVGRYDSPFTGANRDFGWQGPITIGAGQTSSTFTFTSNVSDLKTFYAWVALVYQGRYVHYNNWGFMMTPHIPNLSLSSPITTNPNPPQLGGDTVVSATIKNNESHPIKYSAIGLPARYYGTYNYDVTWQPAGTLTAAGQTGDHVDLSGHVIFDKSGPYTVWASVLIQGRYITVGNVKSINM